MEAVKEKKAVSVKKVGKRRGFCNIYRIEYSDGSFEDRQMKKNTAETMRRKIKYGTLKANVSQEAVKSFDSGAPIAPARTHSPLTKKGAKTWNPAGVLPTVNNDPRYVYRWTRDDKIDSRHEEGWETCTTQNTDTRAPIKTAVDGGAVDTVIRKRELTLMRLPVELKEARDRYYENLQMTPEKMVQKVTEEAKGTHGSGFYGDITVA